ncbi:19200_t:CDS:2 [Racocetra fulgida]|uniref:19200_t:CDS:1 n=1 Tax=Racocetra fulgida TaxID=60492 RepID=A0A9N8WBK5_9GLOM|nr:19200_t:CDS:2 [Racocetra fulgida]
MFTCPVNNCSAEIEIIEKSPLMWAPLQRSMSIDEGSQDLLIFGKNSLVNLDTIVEENSENNSQNKEPGIPDFTTSNLPSKRVGEATSAKSSNKKKKSANREDSPVLKRLIQELSTNDPRKTREEKLQKQDLTSDDKRSLQKKNQREKFIQEVSSDLIQSDTDLAKQQLVTLSLTSSPCKQADSSSFAHLYEKLRDAEDFADRAVQEAIICYCQFGKALIQRRGEIASERQVDPESNAVSRVLNMEVRAQLPADTSDALLWKRIEQAKKLWKLFDAIGMDKIYRIHSFSVSSISKMTNKEIQYIIDNMPVDYSIKIETSAYALPKDGLPSNEKNSELSLPDLSSGSDKKNSELSHINTSNASEEQTSSKSGVNIIPASRPIPKTNPTHERTYFQNKTLDQYQNLYREFSSENFDYYGITSEKICPLCELEHNEEESIEGRYTSGAYFIKCEQREIEIVA